MNSWIPIHPRFTLNHYTNKTSSLNSIEGGICYSSYSHLQGFSKTLRGRRCQLALPSRLALALFD
jgi:hypothetical protein